jgi:hypothetical protein
MLARSARCWKVVVVVANGRVFVEGIWGTGDTFEDACHKLMRDLDEEAAKHGQAVVGNVAISEVDHALVNRVIRLDARTETR